MRDGEPKLDARTCSAQIEYLRDSNLGGHQNARRKLTENCGVVDRVDQVSVSLNNNRVCWPPEVENRKSCEPPPPRVRWSTLHGAIAESCRQVTEPGSSYRHWILARDGVGEGVHARLHASRDAVRFLEHGIDLAILQQRDRALEAQISIA